jgi:hypothetical protein
VDERTLIDQLVTRWEDLRSRGEEPSAEELCRDHPELLETLREALTRHGVAKGRRTETSAVESDATVEVTRDVIGTTQERGERTAFGPFQIVKLLAEGSMGSVYEAFDCRLGRSVALKVMRPELAGHEPARARFLREARAAASLNHDHIVPIYQVGEDQGVPYLAMQLLSGQSLKERLEQGSPLATAEVLRIGREIAEGLAVAHAQGLAHHDLKPANIWLEQGSGRVRILGFGLARAASETARPAPGGSILDTPDYTYMAPEQAIGSGALDLHSDLFSLGSVLYRMATGRPAFPAERTAAVRLALDRDNPVPPRQLNPSIPPALEELILALLAKDPAARPESAQAVVEAIRRLEPITEPAASGGLDLKVQMEESGELPRRAPKRFLAALAVLVAIAGLASTLVDLGRGDRQVMKLVRNIPVATAPDHTVATAIPAPEAPPPGATTLASVPVPVPAPAPTPAPVPVPLPQVQDPLDDRIFEALSADLASLPDNRLARRARATWLARKRRWDEAAADQLQLFTQPADMLGDPGIALAALRLISGQAQHYRVMFETLRNLPPSRQVTSRAAYLVRIGILAPQPGAVADRLVKLSGELSTSYPAPWIIHGHGAALVRAGRIEEGVSRLEQSLAAGPWAGDAMNWLMLALAHERLGHPDVARSWSDRADAWLEHATQAMTGDRRTVEELAAAGPKSHTSYYLPDWLCALALRSELEALRFDQIFPDDPFVP